MTTNVGEIGNARASGAIAKAPHTPTETNPGCFALKRSAKNAEIEPPILNAAVASAKTELV